jgi:type IV pilus biogenesis protein CpaD/CtpE
MLTTRLSPVAMTLSADALYRMPDVELLAAYLEARRQFVEKKFTRDTNRARLEWLRAKMFTGSSGGVTERNMAIDVSEEIARKGQEVREMTRELDLLKVDVDIIAIVIRSRGAPPPAGAHGEQEAERENGREEH